LESTQTVVVVEAGDGKARNQFVPYTSEHAMPMPGLHTPINMIESIMPNHRTPDID
jgi:hypothetical protein